MTKALVLYSGGLDSRLVVRILQEQDIEVETLYFNLPFGCGCCNLSCNFKFTQLEKVKMTIFDTTKEPLLSEYLELLKEAKHGRGSGYNPCTDCKIFMLKKAKEYADKNNIEIIATGEVLGQRPMSQTQERKAMIDKAIGFEVLRPLSATELPETKAEKEKLVDRTKFYSITGRSRKEQMKLAKKFDITFPSPGGGCLLCEKMYKKRFFELIPKNLITEKTLPLIPVGRHYMIESCWYIVARTGDECEILDNFKETLVGGSGTPSVYSNCDNKEKAEELQKAFSKGTSEETRKQFEKFKL
jgi:tRNA-uridine 2-sulfurtransferase